MVVKGNEYPVLFREDMTFNEIESNDQDRNSIDNDSVDDNDF